MCKISWINKSIHNVESGKYANKTSTVKKLQEFCGRKAFLNLESTLWYFTRCGKPNLNFADWKNYNVDFLIHGRKMVKDFPQNWK